MAAHYDIVVVGAGPQGLVAAKTYLQLSPATNLRILDSNKTLGGVWAKENIYPGLKTNNLLGMLEFTDFPFRPDVFGVKEGEHIAGEKVYAYLRAYAEKFGLAQRLDVGKDVLSAEHLPGGGWKLGVRDLSTGGTTSVTCGKLLVATGMTSRPLPVSLPGAHQFTRPLMTFAEFRQRSWGILDDKTINHVAVIGGSKAAFDAVSALAMGGKKVTWIIRASGYGPVWMVPAHIYLGPLKCWLEKLVTMRLMTWLSPCVWGHADGFGTAREWLHGTRAGRWIVKNFWGKLTGDVVTQTKLLAKGEEVKKLHPHEGAVWYGAGVSILNYDNDIYDLVQQGKVKLFRKDVECLEDGDGIKFTDGAKEHVDMLICSTGWKWTSGVEFYPKEEHAQLGVPSVDYSRSQREQWDNLESKADAEILERFPMLAEGPGLEKDAQIIPYPKHKELTEKEKAEPAYQKLEQPTPWRLFRGIAPPDNPYRDIAFLGMMLSLQTVTRSEIVSLWSYAYLNDKLSPEGMTSLSLRANEGLNSRQSGGQNPWLYDIALFSRFGRWRYPMGYGAKYPDFVFDGIPFHDLLLGDLGLRKWRSAKGWFGEVFRGGYGPSDYVGLVDEWKQKHG
ncbi:MAG: hypothetical protein LQ351_001340 [Letrouitia transgressa]|nr:MAG: hypothetical protein LQ351_001340 [Letrouitia transgressa]